MKTGKSYGTAGWIEDGIMLMNARTSDRTYDKRARDDLGCW